jgi:anhydro-N-acetylmuramic acid kinase
MVVAGVMSGTSADGVDVALCRIGAGVDGEPRVKVLGWRSFPYERRLRKAVLGAMDAKAISVAEMSRLHWRLGAVYADAVAATCEGMGVAAGVVGVAAGAVALMREAHLSRDKTAAKMGHPVLGRGSEPGSGLSSRQGLRLGLVGCHGQTVYHQGLATQYLGSSVRATWQVGEAAVIAERLGCPVVSDFRPADLAAGGQGAPLVPMLDWVMFRSARVGRVLQNLGGIGNLTAIAAGVSADKVIAFDTGPGNMVIDGCMRRLFGKEFDRGGAVGRRGRVIGAVVSRVMEGGYFSALPPKSCGREEFGDGFVEGFVARCRTARAGDADVVATATALTAESVVRGYRDFVMERMAGAKVEYAVAGGGAKNLTLMGMLRTRLEPMAVRVRAMEDLGVAVEAKEAVAFALLAWLTSERRVGNVVSATGARRSMVLGKVSF